MADEELIAPSQAAEMLGVARSTLRLWSSKGLLKATFTAGGHRRFRRSELIAFARERSIGLQLDSPRRFLVVDDDRRAADILKRLLLQIDPEAEVETANGGFEAGRKLESFRPGVVLLDIHMPDLNGIDLCQSVRTNPAMADVRIVAMTGDPGSELVQAILNAGSERCLEKPISLRMLEFAIA